MNDARLTRHDDSSIPEHPLPALSSSTDNLRALGFPARLVRLEQLVAHLRLVLAVRGGACVGEGGGSETRETTNDERSGVPKQPRRGDGSTSGGRGIGVGHHAHANAFCDTSAHPDAPASCVTPAVCIPMARLGVRSCAGRSASAKRSTKRAGCKKFQALRAAAHRSSVECTSSPSREKMRAESAAHTVRARLSSPSPAGGRARAPACPHAKTSPVLRVVVVVFLGDAGAAELPQRRRALARVRVAGVLRDKRE